MDENIHKMLLEQLNLINEKIKTQGIYDADETLEYVKAQEILIKLLTGR